MIIYTAIYLVAIVIANLLVAHLGASITPYTAFLLIGLDFTLRDKLHDKLKGKKQLFMIALIVLGGLLSYMVNSDSSKIAIASSLAFLAAGMIDFITYVFLAPYARFYRVNGSNILAALTDSVLFPLLAFGLPLMPMIVLGQFVAKTLGGYVWYLVLGRK